MHILNNLKKNSYQLEYFINKDYQIIYDSFQNQTHIEPFKYKKEVKQYIREARRDITSLDCSNKINGDFIALLIETCEKLHLLMEFKLLYNHLSKSDYRIGDRLRAIFHYSNIQKFDDYYDIYLTILGLLNNAYNEERESKEKITITLVNFYLNIVYNFGERNRNNVLILKSKIYDKSKEFPFLDKSLIDTIFNMNIDDFRKAYHYGIDVINNYLYQNGLILIKPKKYIVTEVSNYSRKVYKLKNPNFNKIRKISKNHIISMGNPNYLHYQLNHGTTIIEEENLLYKYLLDYGKMHKEKLYSSFNKIVHRVNNKTINIIDWGCGQALATSLLIDYIKENELNIDISNITLIEPSSLALSRGMLHIDVLKENKIEIKAVNKDIDSLEISDLIINNSNITLHLFSNILDVEFFRLDRAFLEKISSSQKGLNYFICVSPNINDKRNARLDMFYRYFNANFETELISERRDDIEKYKRYEKVFTSII